MRLSCLALVAAAVAVFTSGSAASEASGHAPDVSTMTSPDATVSLGSSSQPL
ncbi:hypothetical protein PI125_g11391 [Phytophthora idaei]|nr:hypothetical protein PI125_g11391 [Phytophthora idaei]KAG3138946.1 hypothetical protein PI126_g16693 [Phytophthora idaei]